MATHGTDVRMPPNAVWKRGLFMLLFIIAFGIAEAILGLIAVVQFLWLLFTREPNQSLVSFGKSLAFWLADVAAFQSCATEQKPFPWDEWPREE